ncbi:gamma carbonic anhydrase family protein [Spectribacter hydrogenoxidans]|uniref:Gamma carbonic anhydrase family protein n=1 Tax=Spectribacter hydrogenoxidans TaxID=3075608 RepID=A0ABU3C1W2_9GAMM|nr:gamma carbonic anhydrase family protein [Salinisphaera sp. W335]MDT0635537.1 gamma carbonic anhydrase family protein [Salinisphaera sp. W335]
MIYSLGDKTPVLPADGDYYIADNATVIGDVVLEKGASVWFQAVIRGDCDRIVIGEESNIQDGAVIHTDPGIQVHVGRGVTVGHQAMLHGCELGENSLIGIQALILNGAKVGRNCLIGAQALIPEGAEIPDNSLVLGSPGKVKRELDESHIEMLRHGASHYVENGRRFREQLRVYDPETGR